MNTAATRWWRVARAGLAACGLGLSACSSPPSTDAGSTTTPPSTASPGGSTTTTTTPVRRSTGCGKEPSTPATTAPPGDVVLSFAQPQEERSYRLGVPASYGKDTPAPLILNLHGSGSTAEQQTLYSDVPQRAGARGFVTVTPDAKGRQWELTAEGPDRDFLEALVDDVEQRYCVDLDRVHAMGLSLGAWKAALSACVEPDRYASVALVTVEVHPPNCRPLPVVAFHGTADNIVPYGEGADPDVVVLGGNVGLPGARSNIASWARTAGCAEPHREDKIGDDVAHWTFDRCQPGLGVEFYSILHGGHTWPGATLGAGRPGQTATIDATAIALDWFEAHPRRR